MLSIYSSQKVCLIGLIAVVSSAVRADDVPITTDAAYLAAVEEVNANFHLASMYGGLGYVWDNHTKKLESLLSIEDRTQSGVDKSLRLGVSMACVHDLIALKIADDQTHPLTGAKLTPIQNLPKLLVRTSRLQEIKDQDTEGLVATLSRDRVMAWVNFARFHANLQGHQFWAQYLKELPQPITDLPEVARCDPFWSFFRDKTSRPDTSDTYPEPKEKPEFIKGGVIDLKNQTAVRIEFEQIDQIFDALYTIGTDDDLHIDIEISDGSVCAICSGTRAWNKAGPDSSAIPRTIAVPLNSDLSHRLIISRRNILRFEEMNVPATGSIVIWKGSSEKAPAEVDEIIEIRMP